MRTENKFAKKVHAEEKKCEKRENIRTEYI